MYLCMNFLHGYIDRGILRYSPSLSLSSPEEKPEKDVDVVIFVIHEASCYVVVRCVWCGHVVD